MSRIGQYLIDQVEQVEAVIEGEPEIDIDGISAALDISPADVQRLLDFSHGMEEFPVFSDATLPLETLLPAVGTEEFSERLLLVWQAVKRWLKEVIQWFTQVFDTASASLKVLSMMVDQAEYDIRNASIQSRSENTRLVLTKYVRALSIRYRPVEDMGKLNAALAVQHKHNLAYYQYVNETLKRGLPSILNKLRGGDVPLDSVVEEVLAISPLQLSRYMQLTPIQGQQRLLGSAQLLGSLRFAVTEPSGDVHRVSQLHGIKLDLNQAEMAPRALPNAVEIPRFDRILAERSLRQLKGMIKDLSDIVNGPTAKQHRRLINDIEALGERLKVTLGRSQYSEEEARQLLLLLQLLTTWMTRPYQAVITHSMRSMRGTLALCQLNMK